MADKPLPPPLLDIVRRLTEAEWGVWLQESDEEGKPWHRPPWMVGSYWPDLLRDARRAVALADGKECE